MVMEKDFQIKGDSNIESKWIWNASPRQAMQSVANLVKIGH